MPCAGVDSCDCQPRDCDWRSVKGSSQRGAQSLMHKFVLGVVAFWGLAISPAVSASLASPQNTDIVARLEAGEFASAERLARERLAAFERKAVSDSLEVADVLDLLSEAMRQ